MTRRSVRIAASIMTAGLMTLAGCKQGSSPNGGVTGSTAATTADPIPNPDTNDMQRLVREAFDTARAAVVADPKSAAAWGVFGEVCDVHELYDHARTCYAKAFELDPASFRWAYLMAMMLDYTGADAVDVAGQFAIAEELDPNYAAVHFRRGDAMSRAGRYEEAVDGFLDALALDRGLLIARRRLGQTYLVMSAPMDAIKELERVRQNAPTDRATTAALARAYTIAGRTDEARALSDELPNLVDTLVLIDPIRVEVNGRGVSDSRIRARIPELMRNEQLEEAVEALKIVLETRPNDAASLERLGACLLRLGRIAEAEEAFQRGLAVDDSRSGLHVGAGMILLGRNEIGPAGLAFQIATEKDPANGVAWAKLGTALAMANHPAESLAAFAEAERNNGLDAQAERNWAAVLMRAQDPEAAIEHFLRAIELRPDYASAHYGLAGAYELTNQMQDAIQHYEIADRLQPESGASERLRVLRGG